MTSVRDDPFSRTREYKVGDTSQRLLAEYFKRYGWFVIPSYDYTSADSKAPKMVGAAGSFVLPDLDICKRGDRRWAEAKYKARAAYYRKAGRLVHGIAKRHFDHYLRVAAESGAEIWLFIHEGCTGNVLARRLEELVPHGQHNAGNGMLYFPRRQFQRLATIHHEAGWEETRGPRELMDDLLASGAQVVFDKPSGSLQLGGRRGQMTLRQMMMLQRLNCDKAALEVFLTRTAALELLPWFGEV